MPAKQTNEALTPGGVAIPPPIRVESAIFTGSLVTLFQLARDGRIDLTDIPLAPVCVAYVEYLGIGGSEDVDSAGAALLALAYLVERKAWGLLPIADPPPPQDLPELPEPTAHEFARAIDTLADFHRERGRMFFRPAGGEEDAYEIPIEIGSITAGQLAKAFERIISRATMPDVGHLAPHRPSLADVMKAVLGRLKAASGRLGFEALFPEPYTRLDAVFVFLAVLELLRVGQVRAEFKDGEIWFNLKSSDS